MVSTKLPTLSVERLEQIAGRKRRRKKRLGDTPPLEKTRSGGGKKSRRKGTNFENTIAKQFAAWWGCSVRRTPGSGGFATKGGFGPKGDLYFADKNCKIHVECKKHEGWDLADLITGVRAAATTSSNSISKWWQQTLRDCPVNCIPMLIFARNQVKLGRAKNMGVPPLLLMRRKDLDAWAYITRKVDDARVPIWNSFDFIPHFNFSNDEFGTIVICQLSDFFKYVRPPKQSPNRKTWKRGE